MAGLPDADRRLAHELAAGVLRSGDALDAIIAPLLTRGIDHTDPSVLEILRLGVYQLRELERVPAHAAVATAVSLTRERVGERLTGVVNAVLRRVTRLPPETRAATDTDLATRYSHPAWLVDRWLARFGVDDTTALLEWNNAHPMLVVQPTDGDLVALATSFDAAGVRSFPAPFDAGLIVGETRPERLPGFGDGRFFVQDPAQALVVRFAGTPEGATVFDACAAPGGKTLGLAREADLVIAGELSRRRIPRLRENLTRSGVTNVRLVHADALHPPIRPVDLMLLDAPCLGTGTFARHPDARLRVRPGALTRLAREQAQLLDAAADRVRPGGVLCYATCSLEPEENAIQIDHFLARHPTFRRAPVVGLDLPMTDAGDLEILPQRDAMDGAFAARLVRQSAPEP
ncbi:MAG TPA: 16S rRNA (cytosine(967)-C(5))-methyltransferase RsmB [Gemmatimonadales bacterium]|nr:16S rRNA (cytosine(967)-C(5))-methyltransferase RsmB [Gemmatimonadales bacterium]